MESVGSGGRFDSELKPVTSQIKTEIAPLVLRLLREEDAEELSLRVDQNREHLRQWASWVDGTKTTSDTLKYVRLCLKFAVSGTGFHYALLLDGEIVGVVTFNTIEKINRCATMGYWLAKSQTGRGLMTTAANTLISEGFRQLELNRIQATVATENYPSQAVCDRLGLKKEGILRQAEWVNDHFVDLTMNSVLRTEWQEWSRSFERLRGSCGASLERSEISEGRYVGISQNSRFKLK
jgi:ribosomal-protein-serine acetyltransferase